MSRTSDTQSGERPELPPHPPRQARMTYEEFLTWADEDTLAEWVDGAVMMTSPANLRHQELVRFLYGMMALYGEIHALGTVMIAPFQMKLAATCREPDLFYLAAAHRERLKDTYLDGPADLVVEVISPESAGRDRGDKFYEYRDAGIPEYWLIDPRAQQAEFYQIDPQGRYQLVTPDDQGIYRARALSGFWLRVAWLWQDPLPAVTQALLEVDRAGYSQYLRDQLRQAGLE